MMTDDEYFAAVDAAEQEASQRNAGFNVAYLRALDTRGLKLVPYKVGDILPSGRPVFCVLPVAEGEQYYYPSVIVEKAND